MITDVSLQYARALFDLANGDEKQKFYETLLVLEEVIINDSEVLKVFEHPLLDQILDQQGEDVPDAVVNAQMALIQSNYEEARKRKEKEVEFPIEKDYGFLHPFSSQ